MFEMRAAEMRDAWARSLYGPHESPLFIAAAVRDQWISRSLMGQVDRWDVLIEMSEVYDRNHRERVITVETRSDDDIEAVFQQINAAQEALISTVTPEPTDSGILSLPSELLLTRTTNFSPPPEEDERARLE